MHGFQLLNTKQPTRLQILYQQPIQAHAIRNWLTSHPRIVLPILFFLLGTLTYTVSTAWLQSPPITYYVQVFDPIRALSIEGKMLNWFDYRGLLTPC
jgi:hypothetical protein